MKNARFHFYFLVVSSGTCNFKFLIAMHLSDSEDHLLQLNLLLYFSVSETKNLSASVGFIIISPIHLYEHAYYHVVLIKYIASESTFSYSTSLAHYTKISMKLFKK